VKTSHQDVNLRNPALSTCAEKRNINIRSWCVKLKLLLSWLPVDSCVSRLTGSYPQRNVAVTPTDSSVDTCTAKNSKHNANGSLDSRGELVENNT